MTKAMLTPYNTKMVSSNTNWNLYKSFYTVFQTKNINRAAELLGVSRPAVSQNIRELGDQLGFTLFNAHSKGVEPTDEAKTLYETISKVVAMIADVEDRLQVYNSECSGTINAAVHSWFARCYVDAYIKEFRAKYPKVRLVLSQEENVDLLKQRKLDFIFNFDYLFMYENLHTVDMFNKIIKGHFVASKNYAKEHGLDKPITKAELVKHPLIDRKEPLQKYWSLSNDHVSFETIIEIQTEGQIPSMVKRGVGISMLNKPALMDLNDPDIVELDVTDYVLPTARLVCAHNTPLSKPAQIFLDGLLKFCRAKGV